MEKDVLEANKKIKEEMLKLEIERFKNCNDFKLLEKEYLSQMRILLEIERKVALENNEVEFANYIKKIIDIQTNEIHKINEAFYNNTIKDLLLSISFHKKVSILGYAKDCYYDNVNDPYEVLDNSAKEFLRKATIEEADEILKSYNYCLKTIKEIPVNKVYEIINNNDLALNILYTCEEI